MTGVTLSEDSLREPSEDKIQTTTTGGKGGHRNFRHPKKGVNITLSGTPGQDAKRYQINDVKRAMELIGDEEK
jgi:hypothetical protein